jgi:hypothetical protein
MGGPSKDPPLPEAHEAAPRSKSRADANLIPSSRTRVGDGTVDPSWLPYVKGTKERRTLTRDEYYEWQPPPMRRTTPAAEFVRNCQNPNCSKPRDLIDKNGDARIEPFPGGRCTACYAYLKRTGKERPRERVLRARYLKAFPEWRARRLAQFAREREDAERAWLERGICCNGHHVTPSELDDEGRCKPCRNHYYKTGREKPFDNDAFTRGNAERAEQGTLAEWFLEPDDDNTADLADDERALLRYLERGAPPRGLAGEDVAVLSYLARHDDDEDDDLDVDDPDDAGSGWGLDPGELGKL